MRKAIYLTGFMLAWMLCSLSAFAASKTGLVASWKFDEEKGKVAVDSVGQIEDEINGNFKYVEGASGSAITFDGYTTSVSRKAKDAPQLREAFTIEAWVAPQTYPWNWTAIVNQEKNHKAGYFFGVDAMGHVGLHVAANGKWRECISKMEIPLLKWSHIAGTFDSDKGLVVYINSVPVGNLPLKGKVTFAKGAKLLIGKSHQNMFPLDTERSPSEKMLSKMIFDGLIDEVKIRRGAMDKEQIRDAYEAIQPKNRKPLRWRRFPTEGADKREFGAYYTMLKYDETWDKLWRIGDNSDIVVTFEKPVRIVFWHGINYAASYVTENEIWMGDQSLETGSNWGCNEHMSDKQCRYSHVRLIEHDDARIVVHWRYALCDIRYVIVNEDPQTDWGDWTDEYFVIYPDGVAVRHQILWSSNFGLALDTSHEVDGVPWHQFQETIMFNQPGTRPEDNVEMGALTVATMEGESYTCMWGEEAEFEEEEIVELEVVKEATIQMTNLKSKYKPFIIFEPGVVIAPWVGEDHSFWNHWPVAQLPNDGRVAPAKDRPSHTSFSCGAPVVHDGPGDSHIAVFLTGMTDKPIEALLPLAKSWIYPAKLTVTGSGFSSGGYDKYQRAYVLTCRDAGKVSNLEFEIAASEKSPVVNLAFVIKNWGEDGVSLKISGAEIKRGKDFRFGHRHRLEGIDLVVWIKIESTKPVEIQLSPVIE